MEPTTTSQLIPTLPPLFDAVRLAIGGFLPGPLLGQHRKRNRHSAAGNHQYRHRRLIPA